MKKVKLISSILIVLILFSACEKATTYEYVGSIADKITIEGNVSSDTIVLDEYSNPSGFILQDYKVIGLGDNEYFEVYSSHNGQPEKLVANGEAYQIFDKQNNKIRYVYSVSDYVRIFNKDIRTILKFKFSDGSEKWIQKKIKIEIDSSLYKMNITPQYNMTFYDEEENEFILQKGKDFHLKILLDNTRLQNNYIAAFYQGFYQGEWVSASSIETDEDEQLHQESKIDIPFTEGIDYKKITITVVGRYSESNKIQFKIRYQ